MRQHDEKLGSKMPDRRAVKFGDMKPSTQHTSGESEEMHPSEGVMSEKYVEISIHRKVFMSEKMGGARAIPNSWAANKWYVMEQEGRRDPYSMFPSAR